MRVQEGICVLGTWFLLYQDLVSCYVCLLNLRSDECDVVSLYVLCCSVNGSVCVACFTVFVNCLVKQFARCLGVFVILLMNVMDFHMPPISKDCSNTFLERSFIYAAPCKWNKLSECIRTSTFDSFRKSVKTMLFTQQYGC